MGALSSFFFVKTSKSKLLGFTPANIYLKYDNSSQDGILVTHITSTDRIERGLAGTGNFICSRGEENITRLRRNFTYIDTSTCPISKIIPERRQTHPRISSLEYLA